MFTQFLGTAAAVYGVLAALKSLLQARQMLARRSAREVSAGFLASYAGGYAIWLAYGLSAGSLPLIVVDTVGLLCAGLTLAVAVSLRGALIRPATWNSRNTSLISPRPHGPRHAPPQPPGMRSEMDIITEDYGVDKAAIGSPQSEPVVSVRGLVKRYGSHEALAGIDLEVRPGEIFAFLGPNGAGKTTTLEILEGFRQRTEGQVCVLGHDPATAGGAWRDRVGVVLQETEPEPGLTVRECLALYAGFFRAPRDIDETIARVGLTAKAGALGTRLSGGQRRRLDFALALIGDPELIFLDEPTTGFDPSARRAA
ncbi:MAG: ATP-binding cassette domain-containing protein [Streptosporangiaceae bacterium]